MATSAVVVVLPAGGVSQRADRQGRIVTEAWERWGLKMINRSDKMLRTMDPDEG